MRLRLTCKCGSEFEARGSPGDVGALWKHWHVVHMLCYGISGWDYEDDGKLVLRPLSPEQRDQIAG